MTRFIPKSVECLKDGIVILSGGLRNQLYKFEFKKPDNIPFKTAEMDSLWHRILTHASEASCEGCI
jgi:hypothetical protein